MERVLYVAFVVACIMVSNNSAFSRGEVAGSQNPLDVREDIKQCEQEYQTKCSFEVLVYPIEE